MGAVSAGAESLWHVFLSLPIITQWAVTILLVAGVIVHLFVYGERVVHEGPSIFTTAGIFFTFLGIAEGLFGFDVQKIDASIPTLLDGLKTAFIASVVGVGVALSIKLRYALAGLPARDPGTKIENATIDDLHNQLVAVQQAIVGNDDSTLLSQLKLTRQDTNDRLDDLRKSQASFMEKMAENNSKALIQALQEVIRDFNTKISEQFGENFKQLNEAVGRLLVWQDSYRTQLSEMIEQQTRTAANMTTAAESYETLVSKAETFAVVTGQLSELLTALETQRTHLSKSLKSLAQLLTTASGSLPQVEAKIIQLTEQMTFGVKQNQDEMTKTVRDSAVAIQATVVDLRNLLLETTQSTNQQTNQHMKQLAEQMTFGVKQNQDEMTKTVRDSAVAVQATVADLKNLLLETMQSTNRQTNEHMKQLADKANEQIVKLDVALETELTKSISTLGRQLTALSSKFLEDYGPLTDKLRQMVQIPKGM